MRITAAEWRGGQLVLTTKDPEAVRFALAFKGEGDYTLSPAKKRRSLDANAYAWVLIDKLADELRMSKVDVYRSAIRDIGGVSEVVRVHADGYETLRRCWERHGVGWQVEQMPCRDSGYVNAIMYYGSSAYDTRQMSALIDHLVQDCTALGIETMPPYKLHGLLESWDGRA